MKKRNLSILGTLVGGLVLQSSWAMATNRYVWSSSKGLQKATHCTLTSQDQIPLYKVEKNGKIIDGIVSTADLGAVRKSSLKELSDSILEISGSNIQDSIEGHKLSESFLQASFDGDDYAAVLCKEGSSRKGYVVFNVFAAGSEDAIAQLAISKNDIGLLRHAKVHNVEEATRIMEQRVHQNMTSAVTAMTAVTTSPVLYTMNGRDETCDATTTAASATEDKSADVQNDKTNKKLEKGVTAPPSEKSSPSTELSPAQNVDPLARAERINGVAPRSEISQQNYVVCSPTADIRVRDQSLRKVLFNAKRLEKIQLLENLGAGKKFVVDGKTYSYIQVQFSGRTNKQTGFIAEEMIKPANECGGQSVAAARTEVAKPEAKSSSQEKTEDNESGATDLKKSTCASLKVLSSAKSNVARRWRNNPRGTGQCALGVRQSLQNSGVGGISGGLGNAIDMVGPLKARGYVEIGIRDAKQIPAGAVMIFSGPYTSSYLKNHRMSRPYGNYVGHVTIKGDDGFYYTDGRTPEPAIGWSGDRNVAGRRNLYAVLVPGQSLVKKYAGTCKN